MGANTFLETARRGTYSTGELEEFAPNCFRSKYADWPDAQIAFDRLCDEDRYENGHSYSGGIGMKHSFVMIDTVDTDEEAHALAYKLIDECDPRVDDKWGPAGCIAVRNGQVQFLFFGWASS